MTFNPQQFAISNTLVKQNARRGHSTEDVIKRLRDVGGHVLYGMLHKLHEPDHFTSWPLYTSHHAANHRRRFVLLAEKILPRFAVILPPVLLRFPALYF